jgi:hypothetical protein
MKVLVAGPTGGLGRSLVPKLIAAGHEVTGMIRSESSAAVVRAHGAEIVFADGLNAEAVKAAVAEARPEVVVHQMTALKGGIDFRKFDESFALTNRLRTDGTDNLLAASGRCHPADDGRDPAPRVSRHKRPLDRRPSPRSAAPTTPRRRTRSAGSPATPAGAKDSATASGS